MKEKKCVDCSIIKPLEDFHNSKNSPDGKVERCKDCIRIYYTNRGRELRGHKSMYENKECAAYLGIVVGERLCKHLFKDVKVMPNGNPGFDIICNRGKKIDVKTSCLNIKHHHPHWNFTINKNKVADYFICVAFDNREDLNPLHMWMIPGDEVNDNTGISISSNTVGKWNKWKRSIEEVQLCCTIIKGNTDTAEVDNDIAVNEQSETTRDNYMKVKVQRRLNRTFITIPHKFANEIVDVMHMKVSKDEKGRLVYEAV